MRRSGLLLIALLALVTAATIGCVRRTIAITSTPSQALVYVNDREVGRTPCEVEFLFYGEYDVRLKLDGYESVVGSGTASAPMWDFIGADLLSEVAPVNLESRVEWNFELTPANNDHTELLARARQLRQTTQNESDDVEGAPRGAPESLPAAPIPTKTAEQGATPLPGSSAVPIPPTDLPSETPGGPAVVPPPAA
ncbi:MAG: PEGA domain-containing protein [Phycisphaerales bacterium]|nr:PEGA domain-containing protein [Phycisphaerales bacterium]